MPTPVVTTTVLKKVSGTSLNIGLHEVFLLSSLISKPLKAFSPQKMLIFIKQVLVCLVGITEDSFRSFHYVR